MAGDEIDKKAVEAFEEVKHGKTTIEQLERQNELLKEKINKQSKFNEELAVARKIRENDINIANKLIEKEEEAILKLRDRLRLEEENQDKIKEEIALREDLIRAHLDVVQTLGKEGKAQDNFNQKADLALKKYFGLNKQGETFLGSMVETLVAGNGLASIFAKIGGTLGEISTGMLAVTAMDLLVQSSLQLYAAQETTLIQFNKLTGAAGKYNDQIIGVERNAGALRITTEEAGEAFGSLYTGMADFTKLNKTEQNKIAQTTAALDKLGISSQTTAANFDIATRSLGMNGGQAEHLQRQLLSTAQQLEMSPNLIAEGFSKAAPQLAKHGQSMVKVFQGLAEQSKATGVSIDKLLAITGKFDTFQGAAETAGKLNAVLGGDLVNSAQLLMATEEERIQILQDSIKNSGMQWHEMNRFQKMAVANAAGITDMAEAAKLFNPEMKGMTKAEKDHAKTTKEIEKMMPTVTSLFDDFKYILSKLAVTIHPLVQALRTGVDALLSIDKATRSFTGGSIGLIQIIATLTISMGTLLGVVKGFKLFSSLTDKVGKAKLALKEFLKSTKEVAEEMKNAPEEGKKLANQMGDVEKKASGSSEKIYKNTSAIKEWGSAILKAGIGIAIAAAGMALLVYSFSKLQGDQIDAAAFAIGVLGATFVGFAFALAAVAKAGKAAGKAAPGLTAFGVAVIMIGAGIAIAAAGMALFVYNFSRLQGEQISAVAESIVALTVVLGLFAIGLIVAAKAGAVAIIPMLAFGGAVALIGAGIAIAAGGIAFMVTQFGLLADMDLTNLNQFMKELATLIAGIPLAAAGMTVLAPGMIALMGTLATGLATIKLEKLQALGFLMQQISKIEVGNPFGAAAEGLGQLLEKLKEFPDDLKFSYIRVEPGGAMEILGPATTAPGTPTSPGLPPGPPAAPAVGTMPDVVVKPVIKVYLNKRVLAEALDSEIRVKTSQEIDKMANNAGRIPMARNIAEDR